MDIENNDSSYDLANKPIRSLLLAYTLPSLVGMLVTALYNIVDRIFIGQKAGELALSGLTLTFPIMTFLQAFGMLIGIGAASRVSIALGRNDKAEAERILSNAIVLTFITQFITIIPTLVWLEPLLQCFGGSEQTIPYASDYLKILIPGNLLCTLCLSYNTIMRASGYPKKAMYTMLIGGVLNIFLDWLFVAGFDWGIKGVAWATVISMGISAVFVMHHFFDKNSVIYFKRENLSVSLKTSLAIISIGLSPFAVQILGSAVAILFNKSFVWFSESQAVADLNIGVYGIINSYALVAVLVILGITQGMQPIVGYNYGAGLYDRVKRVFKLCAIVSTVISCLLTISTLLIPELIAKIFTSSDVLVSMTGHAMPLCLLGFFMIGFQITSTQFLQSLGLAKKSFILSISRQMFFLIPILITLPRIIGIDGIWLSAAGSDILAGVLGLLMIKAVIRQFDEKKA